MERWYVGFRLEDRSILALNELRSMIKNAGLDGCFQSACYGDDDNKQDTVNLFFTVSSEQKGMISEKFRAAYNRFLRHQKFQYIGEFTMEEVRQLSPLGLAWLPIADEPPIQPVLKNEPVQPLPKKHSLRKNLSTIKMHEQTRLSSSDPFNYIRGETIVQPDAHMSASYNDLLYWLSAYGRGTWQQFRIACKAMEIDSDGEQSRRIMRRLRSLGHVELSRDGQTWFIAPAALVEIESDKQQYRIFLAGQRSITLLEELKKVARVETEPQPYGDAPQVVRAVFVSRDAAKNFVTEFSQKHHLLCFAGLAALEIASRLNDLSTWEMSLPSLSIALGNYHYEQWVNGDFRSVHLPRESGLYRLTHTSTRFEHPQLTLFYNSENNTWQRGDWYGLRYLMLRRTGEICEFHYDHSLSKLSIPLKNRLPDMYERSLVLASGRLPIFKNGWVVFGAVSETLAHMLAKKLEAELIEYKGI